MVICKECGAQNEDNVIFCYKCGAQINEANSNSNDNQNAQFSEIHSDINICVDEYAAEKYQAFLISPDEKVIAQIGNGYYDNFVSSGSVSSVQAFLTDRRLYLQGKFWAEKFSSFKIQEKVIDIREITGSGFEYSSKPKILVMGVIEIIIINILILLLALSFSDDFPISVTSVFLLCTFVMVVHAAVYFLSRRTLFVIEYAGGRISFDTKMIGLPILREFQKQIRMAKDRHMDLLEGIHYGNM